MSNITNESMLADYSLLPPNGIKKLSSAYNQLLEFESKQSTVKALNTISR